MKRMPRRLLIGLGTLVIWMSAAQANDLVCGEGASSPGPVASLIRDVRAPLVEVVHDSDVRSASGWAAQKNSFILVKCSGVVRVSSGLPAFVGRWLGAGGESFTVTFRLKGCGYSSSPGKTGMESVLWHADDGNSLIWNGNCTGRGAVYFNNSPLAAFANAATTEGKSVYDSPEYSDYLRGKTHYSIQNWDDSRSAEVDCDAKVVCRSKTMALVNPQSSFARMDPVPLEEKMRFCGSQKGGANQILCFRDLRECEVP